MTKASLNSLITCLVALALGSVSVARADDQIAERDFTLKVLPLLKTKCFGCHGDDPEEVKGALDVRSRDALLKGGESEEASIVPGDAEASLLYQAVKWDGLEMPPKENDRLSADQVDLIRRWIDAGAPWPDESAQQKHREAEWATQSTAEGVIVATSGGLSDEWTYRRYKPEDVWAFRPLTELKIDEQRLLNDEVKGGHLSNQHPLFSSQQSTSPIDRFIGARLALSGVTPAPQADPATLIRRATFDLLGLPPTPEESAAFRSAWEEDSEQAWSQLIDRLLASPHYGERWAQHWLDVARYADTGGFSNDYERSNMWRYRDYVIRSFNDDKPYRPVRRRTAGR